MKLTLADDQGSTLSLDRLGPGQVNCQTVRFNPGEYVTKVQQQYAKSSTTSVAVSTTNISPRYEGSVIAFGQPLSEA
jgi:hypothetical protein